MAEYDEKTLAEVLRNMPWSAIVTPLLVSLAVVVATIVIVLNSE